jgi:hypothetical protein
MPPCRVKKPWVMPSVAARLGALSLILSGVTMAGGLRDGG